MKTALSRGTLTILIFILGLYVNGQTENELNYDFDRIFGPVINYNDTSLTITNKITIIHSVVNCSIIAFKENGKIKWNTKLPHSNCNIIYIGLIEKNKIKNSEILIQLGDKTIKGINSKNGKMTTINPKELNLCGYERNVSTHIKQ